MGAANLRGVADGAPILLRPPKDLPRVGENTVPIAAIDAVELFDGVQIAQPMTIKDDVIAAGLVM